MTTTIEPEHGSYAGYQWHRKNGEPPCDECVLANSSYQTAWRRNNPDKHAAQQRTQYARIRALRKLAKLHPEDMRQLYQQELKHQ